MNKQSFRDVVVPSAIGVFMLLTLGMDIAVPLGYTVWCLYFIAVGATLFQTRPGMPFYVAIAATVLLYLGFELSPHGINDKISLVSRGIGMVSAWAVAFVSWQALRNRRDSERLIWLQRCRNALSDVLRGDQSPESLAVNAVSSLCRSLQAQCGALYLLQGDHLVLAGGLALSERQPRKLDRHSGLLGAALQAGVTRQVGALPADHLPVVSSLGRSAPAELLLMPITVDGMVSGVIELGRLAPRDVYGADQTLLEQTGELIGIALQTALFRRRQNELLEETQQQSEELQTQQEELRVANEELEEQSRALQHSQASLESQQAELEQTNVQLEERTQELERQKQSLVKVQSDLVRNAQSLEATSRYKSEFLANMSHELRTPLNSSLILAKLLADNKSGTLTDEQVKYAQAIHSSNNDLLALINDILDLSKIEAGHVELNIEPVSLGTIFQRVHDTFEPLISQKRLRFVLGSPPELAAPMQGDTQRILQILKNLLANAIKFTNAGEISLRVESAARDRVRFIVCDSGIGIPRDQQAVIFEAFRQADGGTSRRFGGTGLGLSISRELAQRMGGDISVDSEPGRGSCFTLELPLHGTVATPAPKAVSPPLVPVPMPAPAEPAVSPAAPHATPDTAPPSSGQEVEDDSASRQRPGRLILAVEDDSTFAQALVELAHELDFDCVVASTAEDALRLAPELSPSGILLDIGLPDASGLSVLERLKRDPATRHIPVHVVSALDRTHTALELGAVGFVLKPATRDRLAEAIQQLEDRQQREVRNLLIIEDDAQLRSNLKLLLAQDHLNIVAVGTVADALEQLSATTFDCMITDLALPDGTGYDLLKHMATNESLSFPPVIVYTGRALTRDEEQRLRRYSKTIIIKGARSPERLLDEVTLFLHSVEASLPASQQRLLRQARQRDAMLDGRTILLVEDDVRNIFALTAVLEPLGVNLEVARNGREALEHLQQHDVDLVLMDIMMPEMDGLTAMRRIREQPQLASLPIIALTAKAMADDREECLAAGANDYIAKPIQIDKLVSLCRVWCPK
ncbi:response regulator [Rhodanobacter sp. FW021-MT20]|uniref:response regulator n=1 Tax=Rhodanobacter sp. FW021-MT20 TaxID=1162282 RepID=UPI003F7439ED